MLDSNFIITGTAMQSERDIAGKNGATLSIKVKCVIEKACSLILVPQVRKLTVKYKINIMIRC